MAKNVTNKTTGQPKPDSIYTWQIDGDTTLLEALIAKLADHKRTALK